MTTITIPARDLQRGDRFDFCGRPATVHFATDTPGNAPTSTGIYFGTEGGDGTVWVTPDTLVTIDRPDPDADLIERMAQAIRDSVRIGRNPFAWDETDGIVRDEYRRHARAALAVVRADQ